MAIGPPEAVALVIDIGYVAGAKVTVPINPYLCPKTGSFLAAAFYTTPMHLLDSETKPTLQGRRHPCRCSAQ